MNNELKRPSTYLEWTAVTVKGCFLAWRNLRTLCPDVWVAVCDLSIALWWCLLTLLMPLMTPFAPILALFLRREYRRQEARHKQKIERFYSNVQYGDEK